VATRRSRLLGDSTTGMPVNNRVRGILIWEVQADMNIRFRFILAISLGYALAIWLPAGARAGELKEAQVT